MTTFLNFEQDGPLVVLTMNQPERRNPLTGNTAVAEFLEVIERIHADRRITCVILTGNGPAFSSGGDIRRMRQQASPEVRETDIRQEYRTGIQRLTLALFNLEVPVIAAVNGPAIGAGLDLCCMCDIRIASEQASFAESFVKLGIIPGDGGAWLLPRIVGLARAAELAFTGDTISARQALDWQLVSQVVPHDDLLPTARELAARITRHPSHALRLTKRLMREAIHARLDSVLELSAVFQAICHKEPDHLEAVDAFLERRAPQFR
jgi:enoyl-CoA hydratase/carnithine racemase